jgi:ubiquinone/menaquinone biosynthesis C-methylase UbiE
MGALSDFYERRIFPWLNDRLAATPELIRLRAEALAPARGLVVEIGFGTGQNLIHYPTAVASVTAIEPNVGMLDRAAPIIRASRIPVQVIVGRAEALPLPDRSADTAVSTLTLCSVADPARALSELRRVLKDDGRLIVLEHGLSNEPGVVRWQQRLDGLQTVLACGCHLNRPVVRAVETSGFRFEQLRAFYAPGVPRTHGWISLGTAVKA